MASIRAGGIGLSIASTPPRRTCKAVPSLDVESKRSDRGSPGRRPKKSSELDPLGL